MKTRETQAVIRAMALKYWEEHEEGGVLVVPFATVLHSDDEQYENVLRFEDSHRHRESGADYAVIEVRRPYARVGARNTGGNPDPGREE